jgi:hypothetical protein
MTDCTIYASPLDVLVGLTEFRALAVHVVGDHLSMIVRATPAEVASAVSSYRTHHDTTRVRFEPRRGLPVFQLDTSGAIEDNPSLCLVTGTRLP